MKTFLTESVNNPRKRIYFLIQSQVNTKDAKIEMQRARERGDDGEGEGEGEKEKEEREREIV